MRCYTMIPVRLEYNPESKSSLLTSQDKVTQINKLNSTKVLLNTPYLNYLIKHLLVQLEEDALKAITPEMKDLLYKAIG